MALPYCVAIVKIHGSRAQSMDPAMSALKITMKWSRPSAALNIVSAMTLIRLCDWKYLKNLQGW